MLAGDPIELGAAAAVLMGRTRGQGSPISIASDKSGVGHTEPAAGMSGIAHAVSAASMRLTSPVIHLRSLNPYLMDPLATSVAATISIPRQTAGTPLGATPHDAGMIQDRLVTGVSSFAFQVSTLGDSLQGGYWTLQHAYAAPYSHAWTKKDSENEQQQASNHTATCLCKCTMTVWW